MANLSRHISEAEFIRSQTAIRSGISNNMNEQQKKNAIILCNKLLEPIRQYYGKPLIITSGFRAIRLNQLIGGSKTSQHCEGKAADFYIAGVPLKDVFNQIIEMNLPYDQLIWEFGEWIHISWNDKPRKQVLEASRINGKVVYRNIQRI